MKNRVAVIAVVGVLAFIALGLGAVADHRAASSAYLAAFGVVTSVSLGALVFVMIGHVTGARWLVPLRPYGEAVASLLVPLAFAFAPVAFAARWLYPWARPRAELSAELAEHIAKKRGYLDLGFFTARGVAFVVSWAVVAGLLARWSRQHAERPSEQLASRMRALSAAALPVIALTLTFAAFDWFMSLEPAWYSNAYGFYFFSGGFAGAVAATTILAYVARRSGALSEEVGASHFHACGRVLLAAVSVWAYLAFAQYFVIWSADVPEEAHWYVIRTQGAWRPVAIALVVAHFVVPFLALLQRAVTRHPARLAVVAGWVLVAHVLDVYWLTAPAFRSDAPTVHWLDGMAFVAAGSLCAAFVGWRLRSEHSISHRDPARRLGLRYMST